MLTDESAVVCVLFDSLLEKRWFLWRLIENIPTKKSIIRHGSLCLIKQLPLLKVRQVLLILLNNELMLLQDSLLLLGERQLLTVSSGLSDGSRDIVHGLSEIRLGGIGRFRWRLGRW